MQNLTSDQRHAIAAAQVMLKRYIEDLEKTPWQPSMLNLTRKTLLELKAAFPKELLCSHTWSAWLPGDRYDIRHCSNCNVSETRGEYS